MIKSALNPINLSIGRPQGFQYEPKTALDPAFKALSGFNANASTPTITIYDYIGSGGFETTRMSAALRQIGAKTNVIVEINSPGGDYFDGVAMYNMLRRHEGSVTTQVMGLAASAASLIAMAGDRIEVAEGANIMIHNAWGLAIGNRHELAETAALLGKLDEAMVQTYAARTGRDAQEIASWMDRETFFSTQESLDYGFADSQMSAKAQSPVYASTDTGQTLREWDTRLAKAGIGRSERRKLFQDLGTQDAAQYRDTQDAVASDDLPEQIKNLINIFK